MWHYGKGRIWEWRTATSWDTHVSRIGLWSVLLKYCQQQIKSLCSPCRYVRSGHHTTYARTYVQGSIHWQCDKRKPSKKKTRWNSHSLFLDLKVVNIEETIVASSPGTALQRMPDNDADAPFPKHLHYDLLHAMARWYVSNSHQLMPISLPRKAHSSGHTEISDRWSHSHHGEVVTLKIAHLNKAILEHNHVYIIEGAVPLLQMQCYSRVSCGLW